MVIISKTESCEVQASPVGKDAVNIKLRGGCVRSFILTRTEIAAIARAFPEQVQESQAHPDTERLDWLINNHSMTLSPVSTKGECVVWDQSKGLVIAGRGSTPREAIDAARSK